MVLDTDFQESQTISKTFQAHRCVLIKSCNEALHFLHKTNMASLFTVILIDVGLTR